MRFATLQASANNAIIGKLSDVSVSINGAASVPAIFTNPYELAPAGLFGMASNQPAITLATSTVPSSPVGKQATFNSKSYLIVANEPDGTGISRLLLEAA